VIVMAGVVVASVRIVARGVHRGDGEEERDDQRAQGSPGKEKARHFVLDLGELPVFNSLLAEIREERRERSRGLESCTLVCCVRRSGR